MTLFVILPSYNESENLIPILEEYARLVQSDKTAHYKIIVVDDGSTDSTAAVAEKFKGRLEITVERHPRNLGLGPALRTGFTKALLMSECNKEGEDKDIAVTMDADNSHSPALIPEMAKKIQEGYDVVIASRYVKGGQEVGLAEYRKGLSKSCSELLKFFFPIENVRDYTCGYRMIRFSLLRETAQKTENRFFKEDSFVCQSELLLNMHRQGATFFEAPLVLRYDLKKGKSKMKVLQTIFRYFLLIFRFKFSRSV